MKQALLKSSLREIRKAPTRFLSIVGIIFLGVAFFVGIAATGPDMIDAGEHYYAKQKLADVAIVSSLGLTEDDLALVADNQQVSAAQAQTMVDLQLAKLDKVVRFMSYDPTDELNRYRLVAGRLPEKTGEIALDQVAELHGDYKIDDTFTIEQTDDLSNQLKSHEAKVVGFVNSPEFIENMSRGKTSVGSGTVDYFAVVPKADLVATSFTRILVSFDKKAIDTAYTDAYEERIAKGIASLKATLKARPEARLAEVKAVAEKQLAEIKKQITDGQAALDDGAHQLEDAQKQLETGKAQLATQKQTLKEQLAKGQQAIQAASTQLDQQEAQLKTQEDELKKQAAALAKSQKESAEQRKDLLAKKADHEENVAVLKQIKEEEKVISALMKSIADTTAIKDEKQLARRITKNKNSWSGQLAKLPETGELVSMVNALDKESDAPALQTLSTKLAAYQKETVAEAEKWAAAVTEYEENLKALDPENFHKQEVSLQEAQNQLKTAQNQLREGRNQVSQQQQDLETQQKEGEAQLAQAQATLTEKEATLKKNVAAYQVETSENMPKLLDAQLQLKNQSRQLAEMQPADYLFSQRQDNPGYTEYKQNANRISSLATVFPIIFFLIAALVSLTTMTRMIDEKRGEIGTLKALGYRNREIASKFLLYSLTAGLIGGLTGLAVGFYLFPTIIIHAYGQLYNLTEFVTPWRLSYGLIAMGVALMCTVGIALIALRFDLRSTAATLLRPKAPKSGRRVWLERIKPIWRRLSFNQKVTMRNLFRYKARMLMTIFGIAGCMSMIVTGFGLRDSISEMVPLQFETLWRYQGIVTFGQTGSTEQVKNYQTALSDLEDFDQGLAIASQSYQLSGNGQTPQDVTVYVPENPEKIGAFVRLQDRQSSEAYRLTDEGAIIDEKLAKLFKLQVGDTMKLTGNEDKQYPIRIAAIAENYVGHFAYLTPTYYQQVFGEVPVYNSEFLLFSNTPDSKTQQAIAQNLMDYPQVSNVTFMTDSSDALDDTVQVLTIVVWVLIVSAGLLALIVLYNLNNINIAERIRELSTIKVLGFHTNELTMYIYRENIILTIIGIGVGLVLGYFEHRYVLQTVELDMLMFAPDIHPLSYLYASLITIFFSFLVGIIVYFKLKKVDMIEALKSNE